MKQTKPVADSTCVNLSRKNLTQRREGAKNAEGFLSFYTNFASSAAWRLCEIKFGIKFPRMISCIFLLSVVFLLSSCFGLNADIVLNANGTGTIALEYHISKSLDALGRLDGNERWNTIPVGRADFERTLDRLPEMRLLSFSSTEDDRNIIISARMEFSSINGLLEFLDASGQRSSFVGDARSGHLILTLSEGMDNLTPELTQLLAGISDGYYVRMSMSSPGGRRASYSFPLYEVLTSSEGINVEFRW